MDPVPERPDAPPPPPEPPKESFIGKYGARITRSENDKLLGRMSINRGGGVTEKIIINKFYLRQKSSSNLTISSSSR